MYQCTQKSNQEYCRWSQVLEWFCCMLDGIEHRLSACQQALYLIAAPFPSSCARCLLPGAGGRALCIAMLSRQGSVLLATLSSPSPLVSVFYSESFVRCFLLFTHYILFYAICYLSLEVLFLNTIINFRKSTQWEGSSGIVWHVQGARVDC